MVPYSVTHLHLFPMVCPPGASCCHSIASSEFFRKQVHLWHSHIWNLCAEFEPCCSWEKAVTTCKNQERWFIGLIVWGQILKNICKNMVVFLAEVLRGYWCGGIHCFCILRFLSRRLRMLTGRSYLIYFILFIGQGSGTCKLWTAFSVNQNI